MLLPASLRKHGISDKLEFASQQWQELGRILQDAQLNDEMLPRFVSQIAEGILANAVECFDHLGQDLLEFHLLPNAPESLRKRYEAGKVTSYFPFYLPQLLNKEAVFSQFKAINPWIYDQLREFVRAMDSDLLLMNYHRTRLFRTIKQMVNEKKHSRVLRYEAIPNEKVFVAGSESTFIFDKGFRNDNPMLRIVLPEAAVQKRAPAFRFVSNSMDVSDLCHFAVLATPHVMDTFYDRFFLGGIKVHKPDPAPTITTKLCTPEEEAQYEQCAHIIRLGDQT
jgi:hypothetical protein